MKSKSLILGDNLWKGDKPVDLNKIINAMISVANDV